MTQEQLQYAQLDTHYLLALSDLQKEQLRDKGRLEAAQDAFADLIATKPGNKAFDPEGYWRMVGRQDVSPAQISSLREIYLFRDAKARERDRAPFRVMGEKLMVDLAMALPQSMAELREVPGMSSYLVQKWVRAFLEAIRRGLGNRSAQTGRLRESANRGQRESLREAQALAPARSPAPGSVRGRRSVELRAQGSRARGLARRARPTPRRSLPLNSSFTATASESFCRPAAARRKTPPP